jgi:polyhydroxybutyrate depolymerase
VPLVLVLHGNSPDLGGEVMREWTTFDRQADRWGCAIAYPDGVGGCWADGRGVTMADEAGVDDVGFLRSVIDLSAKRYGTWPDRAVVGGLPVALVDRQPTHAVSALLIHADRIAPIEGGYSRHRGPNGELRGRTPSLAETAERWRAINRCPDEPGRTHATELSSRTTVGGGAGGTQVGTWTVFGGGHSWPGAPGHTEPATEEFDAAEEICRFAQPLLASADTRRL